ncbi:hypothetical protein BDFB_009652 [Asbolus verrucosus]|uniref:Uncharacterized protein n=1 Tax=Asbolus verrucosus TaxID=1661398 RepID=A0A482VXM7_ASBVE|nr:hypothetical protein BDFB_009652 [Asbolus verrucosus]
MEQLFLKVLRLLFFPLEFIETPSILKSRRNLIPTDLKMSMEEHLMRIYLSVLALEIALT